MVHFNGEERDLAGQNLLEVLTNDGFRLNQVVIEWNFEIIPKDKIAEITIADQDTIEVLQFMGGG